jgi:hypothetical protein
LGGLVNTDHYSRGSRHSQGGARCDTAQLSACQPQDNRGAAAKVAVSEAISGFALLDDIELLLRRVEEK